MKSKKENNIKPDQVTNKDEQIKKYPRLVADVYFTVSSGVLSVTAGELAAYLREKALVS